MISVFSRIFAINERNEMDHNFMSLFGFGISMIFASFHMCGIMLLFCDKLYLLVRDVHADMSMRYVHEIYPCGPICLRCLMLTLSGHVELL